MLLAAPYPAGRLEHPGRREKTRSAAPWMERRRNQSRRLLYVDRSTAFRDYLVARNRLSMPTLRCNNPYRSGACDRVNHPCGIDAASSAGADELGEHFVVHGNAIPSNAAAPACSDKRLAGLADRGNPSDHPGHLLSCGRLCICVREKSPPSPLSLVDVALCFRAAERLRAIVHKASRQRPNIRGGHLDSPPFPRCRNTIRAPCGVAGPGVIANRTSARLSRNRLSRNRLPLQPNMGLLTKFSRVVCRYLQ